MNIFKRKIEFVSAICPKCGGNLELDSTLETAYCQYCGAMCIVKNVKKRRKGTSLEKIIGFVERQQDLRRKDRVELTKKQEEEQKKADEWLKKYWWIFLAIPLFCIIMSIIFCELGL